MFLFGSNRSSYTYVCIACRFVAKVQIFGRNAGMSSTSCAKCSLPMQNMGTRWCPPKKKNNKAWREIAKGNILWDSSRVAKEGLRRHNWRARMGKY